MIHLYRAPWSTNVERVTLAMALKGVEYESIWIDYADRSPVEEVSGQPLVPVIDDGGLVVSDSLAILRHLDEREPEPPLFGSGPAARAQIDLFLDWFDRVWKVAPNAIEADPSRTEELSEVMDGHLDLIEALLTGRHFLMGDELTAADCAAHPFLKYAVSRDPEDDEDFHVILDAHQSAAGRPNLTDWVKRVTG